MLVASFSLTLCVLFGCVSCLHSAHESRFVVFLVAFCKRPGPYQSVVTQSVSCLGAGQVLTMLMTSSLLNCEALCFIYGQPNRPVLLTHLHLLGTPEAWRKFVIMLPLRPGVRLRSWKASNGRALKEILRRAVILGIWRIYRAMFLLCWNKSIKYHHIYGVFWISKIIRSNKIVFLNVMLVLGILCKKPSKRKVFLAEKWAHSEWSQLINHFRQLISANWIGWTWLWKCLISMQPLSKLIIVNQ